MNTLIRKFLSIIYLLFILMRPLIKWFLKRFTNLCELQRLCYGTVGFTRIKLVQRSLYLSSRPQIRHLVHCLDEITSHPLDESAIETEIVKRAVNTILLVKKINPKHHPGFSKQFAICVEAIWGYKRLCTIVENLRLEKFDSNNYEHEKKLLLLWKTLMPDVPLEGRITKQWQDIGFQGDDPATDFRDGILSLENLLYFVKNYQATSQHLFHHSLHPKFGYTFAVVSINISHMAWRLLKTEQVKSHFCNLLMKSESVRHLTIDNFHQLYCYLFYEFDKFWLNAQPENLMQFNIIQEKFERTIKKMTKNENCMLKMNLSVENV